MTRFALLRRARPLQVAFLVLLVVCSAQLAYWMLDEASYTAAVEAQMREAFLREQESARALLRAGASWAEVSRTFPGLVPGADALTPVVDPRRFEALDDERFHRLNRYGWEGAFFLAVLLASMMMVYRAVREEAALRRRQEDFVAGVTHELKSPLASIRLSAETLAVREAPPERRAELVGRMLADVDRLERMVGNLLETSRVSKAARPALRERMALADEVGAVAEELASLAAEGGARLQVDVPPDIVILADQEGVRTVLRNLVHNALLATRGSGTVRVRAAAEGGRVRLEVRDDGIGFPPAEAGRLFDKFYRVEREAPAWSGGTGLGLYLVRELVQLDGGMVSAESEGAGRGARFSVTWPGATELTP